MKMKSGKRTIMLSFLLIAFILDVNAQRRPVIGISDTYRDGTNAAVPRSYVNAVLLTGGIPVVIPLLNDEKEMIELINSLDGIVFTGGEDFDPSYYNERPIPQMGRVNAPRDRFDLKLLKLAAERGVPILGICRGIQLINIGFGGSLYQDLPAQYYDTRIRHRQSQSSEEASHSVIVEDLTVFSDIVKERMLMVNSAHHQAVKAVARGFRVAGRSTDNIVEVIEKIDEDNWILGVQFHPEMRVTKDVTMRRIFQSFIEEAASLLNPDRPNRSFMASRPQVESESSKESIVNKTSVPDVIYKNVIDTQYIYKLIRDTLYVNVPADTIYISVYDTLFIAANTSNNSPVTASVPSFLADTVYIPVYDTVYVAANTSNNSPVTASVPADTVYIPVYDTVYIAANTSNNSPVTASVPVDNVSISPETVYSSVNAVLLSIETVSAPANNVTTSPEMVYSSVNAAPLSSEAVSAPAETVFTSPETVYSSVNAAPLSSEAVSAPANNVTTSPEMVYSSVNAAPLSSEAVSIPAETVSTSPEMVYSSVNAAPFSSEAVSAPAETVSTSPEAVSVPANPVQAIDFSENKVNLFESDTLIFTPGVTPVATTAKKAAVSKSNNKSAEREKEKIEKKLAKEKEKQFQQQQKENAKLDKKELKIRKKQGTVEKE